MTYRSSHPLLFTLPRAESLSTLAAPWPAPAIDSCAHRVANPRSPFGLRSLLRVAEKTP